MARRRLSRTRAVRNADFISATIPNSAGAPVSTVDDRAVVGVRSVAAGNFTLVVKADGSVVGWGRDPDGQAARPPPPARLIPSPVVIDLPGKVTQVALGESTQYALLEDGTILGRNLHVPTRLILE